MNTALSAPLQGVPIPVGFFLQHQRAEEVLGLLMKRVLSPNRFRARGALLVSPPENGKSTLLRVLLQSLRDHMGEAHCRDFIISVKFDAPVGASWRDLAESIGEQTGIPLRERSRPETCLNRLIKGLHECRTLVVVVDELNNLVSGPIRGQEATLDFLKSLSNGLGIPVITAGTYRALAAVELDAQYLSRWPPIHLHPWLWGKQYLALLRGLETQMNLPVGAFSGLGIAPAVWSRAQGLVGLTVELLNDSLAIALSEGADRITVDHIQRARLYDEPTLLAVPVGQR